MSQSGVEVSYTTVDINCEPFKAPAITIAWEQGEIPGIKFEKSAAVITGHFCGSFLIAKIIF